MSVYVYVDFPKDVASWGPSPRRRGGRHFPRCTLIRARRAHAVRRRGSGPSGRIRVSCCRTKYSCDGTSSPPVAPVSVILRCHSRTNTDTRCLNAPKLPGRVTAGGDRAPGCRRDDSLLRLQRDAPYALVHIPEYKYTFRVCLSLVAAPTFPDTPLLSISLLPPGSFYVRLKVSRLCSDNKERATLEPPLVERHICLVGRPQGALLLTESGWRRCARHVARKAGWK